ncbi:MAG TPA: hypothetical protein VN253_05240 [Kofleriaceae bacterium]|nr:hypothetical protein [Kofleriaceae bacterium]
MKRLFLVLFTVAACGGKPPLPPRGVVEHDLGSWKFRRFQGPLLDIEVWVEGNRGEAFSASYITADSEKTAKVRDDDIVNVSVTRYERDDGVTRATVKLARRLAAENGYQVEEGKIAGTRALTIKGAGEAWVMWPAKAHVVKVGGRGRDSVPKAVVERYASRYPSKLPGGALEGPLPPGPDELPKTLPKEEYDPKNPKANLDNYDPKKVKIPERKVEPTAPPGEDEPEKKPDPKAKPPKKAKSPKKSE